MTVNVDGTLGPVQILDQESGVLADVSCVTGRMTGRTCTVVGQDNRRA